MDHQSDVQKQPFQGQHQRLPNQNIVYIQQHPQNFRNHTNPYHNDSSTSIINQSFQDQNASFGLFENHYPLVANGNYSSSNTSAAIIPNSFNSNKTKNDNNTNIKNAHCLSDNNDNDLCNLHQRTDAGFQYASGNFQSIDLQGLNYQQTSPFFLQNLGNHYQLNDNLVSTYQSSGSSESSDESSISNASQFQYSSDSSNISNNQFEFPVPASAPNLNGQNFHQFQQKDIAENYLALMQQDNHVPRCDSSKSETAESTCSSLSSGSTESQSENENSVRLPLIVNPALNNNANLNILHSYQSNIHNNVSSYSNLVEQNENGEFITHGNYPNHPDQNVLKCNNFAAAINPTNFGNENINNINHMLPQNNQVNNVVVMLPNRLNKNIQNHVQPNHQQQMLQNPSSQDVLNTSKFLIQNPKVNQQKIFGLINVSNPVLQDKMISGVQTNQMIKVNNVITQDNCVKNNYSNNRNWKKENNNLPCEIYQTNCGGGGGVGVGGISGGDVNDDRSNNVHNCASGNTSGVHPIIHVPNDGGVTNNCASHIQNTSDTSVINSNFIQNNNLLLKGLNDNENNSAMLIKETSDKNISQSVVSSVNSSVIDSNSVYLVTNNNNNNNENNVIKNNCCDDTSSSKSCFNSNSGINNSLPVPSGWKRLLVDGSIIYLRS
ncbi:ribosomal protein VAR1, putative [Pediculus humanus corporis]|uniref:Ribosomal protein VAR1, putative n=1 Tax=Pediculus humanus subsp. corporis TaxID=121224 RepID=E0VKB5_PEDHC|nr:ribosomal protein VAR1, putative [Pediculus humanus corporis]EEB13821.1 ribosomal protein VAR1, putative [Pediculus humanus corporis]